MRRDLVPPAAPVAGYQLVSEQPAGMSREPFAEHSLEGCVIRVVAEYLGPGIRSIQGMVDAASFVASWHVRQPTNNRQQNQ